MNDILFEVGTPIGFRAVLKRANWERHLAKRADLVGQIENVRLCLEAPEIVVKRDDRYHFYRRGLATGRLQALFLHVLVRGFVFGEGVEYVVVSAWFTRALRKGDVVWSRMP